MSFASILARRAAIAAAASLALLALADSAPSQTQQFQHRWGGFVADGFVLDQGGVISQWTAEDRRIRHRVGTGGTVPGTEQELPVAVEGIVRRIHFLPTNTQGETIGWAVTSDGWVLKTADAGDNWAIHGSRILNGTEPEDLYDVHFLDASDGWLVGLHQIFYSGDGGQNWGQTEINGVPPTYDVEYYAIDVIERANGERLGLICAEPGIVLRARGFPPQTNWLLDSWELVADTTLMCDPLGGFLRPSGDLTCCQTTHCPSSIPNETLGIPYEPWDIEFSRGVSELAVMVGGLKAQCGMAFASADVTTTSLSGAGFVLEQHICIDSPSICAGDIGEMYHCNPNHGTDPCPFATGWPTTDPERLCRMPTLYGLAIFADDTAVATGYNGSVVVRAPVAPGRAGRTALAGSTRSYPIGTKASCTRCTASRRIPATVPTASR